jgi:Na+-driven multidrug efflux pump
MSLSFAFVAGITAAVGLIFVRDFISIDILDLTPEVMHEAAFYWWLRIALIPILLLNMAISGILQGFRHTHVSAIINTCQALAEIVGSVLVLRHDMQIAGFDGLFAMGLVTICTQFLALIAGLVCMLTLPPPEAHGEYSLWKELFSKTSENEETSIRAPLLANSNAMRNSNIEYMDSMASTVYSSENITTTTSIHIDSDGGGGGNGGGADICAEDEIIVEDESLLDFVMDGLAMLVRSMVLQATFFATLVAASRLGTESLAAHSVVNQLWTCISYTVDGLAAAGIVLGSRLSAQSYDPARAADAKFHLKLLIKRVLCAGLLAGIFAGVVFAVWRDGIIQLFTQDPAAQKILQGGIWMVLVSSQPVNGLVFVYDGLMYSSQNFIFIRNYMLLGFVLVFCPLLAVEIIQWQTLWGVWVANGAYNTWRAAGAAYLIHYIFMKEFDAQLRTSSRTPSRPASLQNIVQEEG